MNSNHKFFFMFEVINWAHGTEMTPSALFQELAEQNLAVETTTLADQKMYPFSYSHSIVIGIGNR